MRLVHTADWHLGKRLGDHSLLEDQAHALEQVLLVCRDERADALVIAGDVYDRAVPPEDAVRLLSDFLTRVARELAIQVIVVSGNHDSPERLGFGAGLVEPAGVHLRTSLSRRAEPVMVAGVPIYALPFLEPDAVRAELSDDGVRTQEAAVRSALAAVREDRARHRDAVLVGHLFATGGRESPDSERPLLVGGAAQVPSDALAGFSYVALGHLHEPQAIGSPAIRYSGSLLKYSLAESAQRKGVTVVEVEDGRTSVREVPLSPRRDVVRIEGDFAELLSSPAFAHAEDAYVEVRFTDPGYVFEAASRLRVRFPHLLAAVPVGLPELAAAAPVRDRPSDHRELLAAFLRQVGAPDLDEATLATFERALRSALAGVEREAA